MCEYCDSDLVRPAYITTPLRRLTPETSRGYECITFIEWTFSFQLYRWQKMALIHALELLEDDTYRFRTLFLSTARQNGKTTLMTGVSAFWLFYDAARDIKRYGIENYRNETFSILGIANSEITAKQPWKFVRSKCDPYVDTSLPALAQHVAKIRDASGDSSIRTRFRSEYTVKAIRAALGFSAARLMADEIRELYDDEHWMTIAPTVVSIPNSQIFAFSTAGRGRSVVWRQIRDSAIAAIDDPAATYFICEWSAPESCSLKDDRWIVKANPSIGESFLEIPMIKQNLKSTSEGNYRNHHLNSPVSFVVDPYISEGEWEQCADSSSLVDHSQRRVLAIDIAFDRSWSAIAIAGQAAKLDTNSTLAHVEVVSYRQGMFWLIDAVKKLREKFGIDEICINTKGPASELVGTLTNEGFDVHSMSFEQLSLATTLFRDEALSKTYRHLDDSAMNDLLSHAITRDYSGMAIWDKQKSVKDIAPIVALSMALYGLRNFRPSETRAFSAYEESDLLIL